MAKSGKSRSGKDEPPGATEDAAREPRQPDSPEAETPRESAEPTGPAETDEAPESTPDQDDETTPETEPGDVTVKEAATEEDAPDSGPQGEPVGEAPRSAEDDVLDPIAASEPREGDDSTEEEIDPAAEIPMATEELADDPQAVSSDASDDTGQAPWASQTARDPGQEDTRPEPERHVTVQKVGLVPLVLGGAVAAGLGYLVAFYYYGQPATDYETVIAAQDERLSALEDQVASLPTAQPDLDPIEARLADLESTIVDRTEAVTQDLNDRIAALDERLTSVERAPAEDGTLAETAIESWERELDDIRAEFAAQQEQMTNLREEAQADLEAARNEARQVEQSATEAARQATARAALARVEAAVDSGSPLDAPLNDLDAAGVEIPEPLASQAADGVPTIADLRESFPDAARRALAVARSEGLADEGTNMVSAFLREQLDVRSVEPARGRRSRRDLVARRGGTGGEPPGRCADADRGSARDRPRGNDGLDRDRPGAVRGACRGRGHQTVPFQLKAAIMLLSVIKILAFVVAVTAATFGAAQLMDVSGGAEITIAGIELTLSPLELTIGFVVLIVLVWGVLKLLGLLMATLRFINGDETAISQVSQPVAGAAGIRGPVRRDDGAGVG